MMNPKSFTTTISVDQSPKKVFDSIANVRGWWSEGLEGKSEKMNDEFIYQYGDVHRCKIKLIEVVPEKRIVWMVLENYFSFTKDETEWVGTNAVFDISRQGDKTILQFTHDGLVPEYECYSACVNGWTQYITQSLYSLITTGKGKPNTDTKAYTVHEVALQFYELAKQEKWFEIQDLLFDDDVKSIEPAGSPYLKNAEGKTAVRQKGEDWVKRIEAVHHAHTTEPVVGGNYFAVGREMDITVQGLGRIPFNQLMVYEVKNGKIISEQFFY
jgi:hypothetical protein